MAKGSSKHSLTVPPYIPPRDIETIEELPFFTPALNFC